MRRFSTLVQTGGLCAEISASTAKGNIRHAQLDRRPARLVFACLALVTLLAFGLCVQRHG